MGDSGDPVTESETIKKEANTCFSQGQFDKAIELYTSAIEIDPENAILYSNRSFAHLKMESYGYSLADATKSIELNSGYIKAYYRRASANFAMGKFKVALKDFESVAKAKPSDADAQKRFKECEKIVRKIAFEKAIAVDDKESVVETIDLDSMVIEDSYTGPSLDEDGCVTKEFTEQLLPYLKSQKVIVHHNIIQF